MCFIRKKQFNCKNPCCKNCIYSELLRSQSGERHYLCSYTAKLIHKGKDFCKRYRSRCK